MTLVSDHRLAAPVMRPTPEKLDPEGLNVFIMLVGAMVGHVVTLLGGNHDQAIHTFSYVVSTGSCSLDSRWFAFDFRRMHRNKIGTIQP